MKKARGGWIAAPVAAVIALASISVAAGAPDLWQRAQTPRLARDMAAYRDAQRLFIDAHRSGREFDGRRQLLLLAVRLLERSDAVNSPEPRVRVLYGRILARAAHEHPAGLERDFLERAAVVLQGAIASWPEHPQALDARFALAVAYAKLRRPGDEVRVYEEILQREAGRGERAVTLANQAEAYMVLGELDRAVQGFRSSLAITPDNPLAHWGLAVALDRNGDPLGAVAEAGVALQYDPNAEALHNDNVFFVPAYDRYWYDALGAMARATGEREPSLAALWWRDAAAMWQSFAEAAEPGERWLQAAQARRKLCERKAKEAGAASVRRPLRWVSKP
jgi:tetratricopeptide (TPR) repeat protein